MSSYVPRIRRHLPIAAALLSLAAINAAPAAASTTQVSVFQADPQVLANPTGTLQTLRDLGVNMVRVNLTWNQIAPSALSTHRPAGFNAIDPGAYPAGGWAPYDAVVRAAAADHIAVDFTINGPAPLWATGSGAPRGTTGYFREDWEPSAKEYGYFVRAVGTRYSGSYKPAGSASALPRVSFWSIWNEPNYGYDIAPQGTGRNQSIPNSPHIYRNLLDAAWSSLNATGHSTRTDRILFGEVTPHGDNGLGVFSNMKPLIFLRSLYCVDSELPRAARLGRGGPGLPDDGGRLAQLPHAEPGAVLAPAGSPPIPTRRHRRQTCRPTCAARSCAPATRATPTSPICPRFRGSSARSTG